MKRLAIIASHPIQYNAPWFRLLAERKKITVLVFYTWSQVETGAKYDPGFGKNVAWDIPLLDGYDHRFVKNVATEPGSDHYKGIDNPSLVKEIEEWAPDGILVFGWSFRSHLRVLRHFYGRKKILFRGDSNLLDEKSGFSLKKIMRRLFLTWVYRHVDTALYVGTVNREYYLRHGLKKKQLVFAPHAIDNERFMNDPVNVERVVAGIPRGAFVFIFTGKFETKKDPELLLNAFIQLEAGNTHLLMVGDGKLEPVLRAKLAAQKKSVINRVHFLPFQNQLSMPSIYRMGDVLVLPSRGPGETWGLAVNEAMACSRAVLVSDKCGCAADLVEDGANGFVFKHSDEKDFLKKMETLLSRQRDIEDMGKRSLEIIRLWRFENICEAIERSML